MSDIEYIKSKLSHETIEHELNNPQSWNSSGHTIYGFQNIDFDKFNFSDRKLNGLTFKNCKLRQCYFTATELEKIEFIDCDLSESSFWMGKLKNVRFNFCNIEHSSFISSKISFCQFMDNKIRESHFRESKIDHTNFRKSDLIETNWENSEISFTSFEYSDLKRAVMTNVRFVKPTLYHLGLVETNFSGSTGLLDPVEYIDANFGEDASGLIVFKIFGISYKPNPNWIIKPDSIITEIVNPDRTVTCGCGINVGTETWLGRYLSTSSYLNKTAVGEREIWQGYIRSSWFPGIIVPYTPDGQIRTSRLQLHKKLSLKEIQELIDEYRSDEWRCV